MQSDTCNSNTFFFTTKISTKKIHQSHLVSSVLYSKSFLYHLIFDVFNIWKDCIKEENRKKTRTIPAFLDIYYLLLVCVCVYFVLIFSVCVVVQFKLFLHLISFTVCDDVVSCLFFSFSQPTAANEWMNDKTGTKIKDGYKKMKKEPNELFI